MGEKSGKTAQAYEAEAEAVRAKTARLRELRLAREAEAAQWAIYCWDRPGMAEVRRALLPEQKRWVANFGDRVIGYGHFVADDGRDMLGTSFFMQLDRAAADDLVANEPMSKAGVYQRI